MKRNETICRLSDAVIVVPAVAVSGTTSTGRAANRLGILFMLLSVIGFETKMPPNETSSHLLPGVKLRVSYKTSKDP